MWFKKVSVFGLLIVASLSYLAPALQSCEKHENAALILDESGVVKKIHRITWMTETMMDSELFSQVSSRDVSLAQEIIKAEMQAENMLSAMKNALASSLSLDEMNTLLHWFQSDLAKRINEAEDQALVPESFMRIYNQREQIIADGSKERCSIAGTVCDAIKVEELMAQAQNFMTNIYFVVMGQAETLSSDICGLGKNESLRHLAHATFLQAYQDLTDEEIVTFKDFVITAPAKQFTSTVIQTLTKTMDDTVLAVKGKLYQQECREGGASGSLLPNVYAAPMSCCCD